MLKLDARFYWEELKIEFIGSPRELTIFKRNRAKEGSELVLPFCVYFSSLCSMHLRAPIKGSPMSTAYRYVIACMGADISVYRKPGYHSSPFTASQQGLSLYFPPQWP